ncbi:B-cell receptor-associated protein 31-like [Sinocyclocheilus rhinocerous]|uniref:B-cell receptor-associated protein 31-like n=1 Tax=Sinocyclocheilus rhinocerous TaxID=307959 RepID=UPI0007B85272|nr:PREDICTED: B-cell receptor-associated protein 31-like [Sinocyclocheilus rhinocerous]
MSLQWTAVATFLYAEVFAVLLLCVPFISPKRWSKFFKSRLVTVITTYGNTAFIVIICILVFLLVDAFREVRKYSVTEKVDLSNNPVAIEHIHMKLFRAQRNEYIAGFALLLCLLLRRLATLLSQQATLMASNEAFKKQAEGANDAAKKYMEENEKLQEVSELCMKMPVFHDPKGLKGAETFTWCSPFVSPQRNIISDSCISSTYCLLVCAALQKSDSDVKAMKKQAENLTAEYDRLLEEHGRLQAKCDSQQDKKSD